MMDDGLLHQRRKDQASSQGDAARSSFPNVSQTVGERRLLEHHTALNNRPAVRQQAGLAAVLSTEKPVVQRMLSVIPKDVAERLTSRPTGLAAAASTGEKAAAPASQATLPQFHPSPHATGSGAGLEKDQKQPRANPSLSAAGGSGVPAQSGSAASAAQITLPALSTGAGADAKGHGTAAPSRHTAFESLLKFAIEMYRANITHKKQIYAAYAQRAPSASSITAENYAQYQQRLIETARDSKNLESHPQKIKNQPTKDLNFQTLDNETLKIINRKFFRAQLQNKTPSLSRISLRLRPTTAMEVWHYISTTLVGNHGITGAKVAGPAKINQRSDSVVIYFGANETAQPQQVAQALTAKFAAEYFDPGVPAGMAELARGIGYAEQSSPGASHGKSRAPVVATALSKLPPFDAKASDAENEAKMATALRAALLAAQIDPDHAERNLKKPAK